GHRVAHQPPNEEFEAQVVDALLRRAPRRAAGLEPEVDDAVADGEDGGAQPIMRARDDRVLADGIGKLFKDFVLKRLSRSGSLLRRRGVQYDRALRHVAIRSA